jgi:hypothetical protein
MEEEPRRQEEWCGHNKEPNTKKEREKRDKQLKDCGIYTFRPDEMRNVMR